MIFILNQLISVGNKASETRKSIHEQQEQIEKDSSYRATLILEEPQMVGGVSPDDNLDERPSALAHSGSFFGRKTESNIDGTSVNDAHEMQRAPDDCTSDHSDDE